MRPRAGDVILVVLAFAAAFTFDQIGYARGHAEGKLEARPSAEAVAAMTDGLLDVATRVRRIETWCGEERR